MTYVRADCRGPRRRAVGKEGEVKTADTDERLVVVADARAAARSGAGRLAELVKGEEPMRRLRLSAGEVSEMRRMFAAGHRIADLIQAYDVHRAVVGGIVHRRTYRDVPDDLSVIIRTVRPQGDEADAR